VADFQKAVAMVLRHEGGYANNPNDPGGETSYGISKRSYPNLNIKALTQSQAEEIYRKDYWLAVAGDKIPDQVLAENLLDFAVTSGPKTAVKVLQRILAVTTDGKIGPQTLGAIAVADVRHLNVCLIGERLAFYVGLAAGNPAIRYALKSWIRRVADYA